MKKAATLPFRGIATNSPFWSAGAPFAPPESMSNILTYDVIGDRPRMGSRPGSSQYFYGRFGGGAPVRGCGVVSRGRTPTGYSLGNHTALPNSNGSAHVQGAVTGNVFKVNSSWGLLKYAYENVDSGGAYSDSGPSHAPVSEVAVTPDQSKLIIAETYTDSSTYTVGRVTCLDASSLAVIWSKKLSTASQNRFVSAVCANAEWVFVATNHFVRVFKLSDGSDPAHGNSAFGLNGWSSVCQDVKVSSDGNALYALFLGTSLGTTLGSGAVVTAGIQAQHFRSGVMKLAISSVATVTSNPSAQTLTQVTLSPQLANTQRYYEGDGTTEHNYCRFSEQMPWGPRGCSPVKMALRPSGGFFVVHANAAWGPNATPANPDYFPPDGSAGRWNLSAFKANGTIDWIQDGDSIFVEDGGGGFFNDLLDTTAKCVCADSSGNPLVAGRRTQTVGTADGFTNYLFSSTGDFLWSQDLGATQHSVCVMPSSQLFVSGGTRNKDWNGSPGGSTYTDLWELGSADGAIRRYFPDLGAGIGVNGVQGIGFNGPVPPGGDLDALCFVSDWVG